jgi:hypothetical protein
MAYRRPRNGRREGDLRLTGVRERRLPSSSTDDVTAASAVPTSVTNLALRHRPALDRTLTPLDRKLIL